VETAEHVLRSSNGGSNALLSLEGKFEGKKVRRRCRRTWIVDLLQWTVKNKYHKVKTDRGQGEAWLIRFPCKKCYIGIPDFSFLALDNGERKNANLLYRRWYLKEEVRSIYDNILVTL